MSSFDRLVARTLRRPSPPDTPCPAPEMLAAYVDRALDRDERESIERHASVCPRCAQHLAALVHLEDRVSPIPVPDGGRARPWWLRWQWLVPAAAMVVVVAVWTSLPTGRVVELTAPAGRVPAATPAPPLGQAPAEKPNPTTGKAAEAATPLSAEAGRFAAETSEPPTVGVAARPTDVPSSSRKAKGTAETALDSRVSGRTERAGDVGQQVAVPPSKEQNATLRRADAIAEREVAAAPKAHALAEEQKAGTGGGRVTVHEALDKAAPPAVAGGLAETVAATPAAPAAPSQPSPQFAGASRAKAEAAMLAIASPDPRVSWRVAPPRLERSTDGGRTWTAEATPPLPDRVTGSAPAPDVCWLAGAGGIVLRRDAAGTWARVTSPSSSAIVRIEGRTADEALVTTADGLTFRTRDGGRTWTR